MKKLMLVLAAVAALTGFADEQKLEVMAVYYPHWHKYPKGDEWFGAKWNWDQGEWAFVKDPVTRFKGQVNCMPWVGFLDGKDPNDVNTEIELASNAGIDVFLYDYYWYAGQKTQEEAIEEGFLKAPSRGKMKFALMWCYHERKNAWRKGFGEEPPDCMSLAHTPEEFLGFIDYSITHYFNQPEYWHYKGGLFFSIYNFGYLWEKWGKDADKVRNAFAEARRRVRTAGLGELHLNAQGLDAKQAAEFDALKVGLDSTTDYGYNAYRVKDVFPRYKKGERLFAFSEIDGDLQAHWKDMQDHSPLTYIPIVPTGWDATLRCRKDQAFPWPGESPDYPYCMTFTNSTDALFEKYLRDAKASALADPKKPGVVYVNAWNEYTEGCWLLPDRRRGDLKLRAIARVFGRRPADEYVYTSGLRPWEGPKAKNGKLLRVATPDVENVKYGPHERQGMDVWFPPDVKAGERRPTVVVIHGGGWTYGDRVEEAGRWAGRCREAGYTLVTVGYRFIQDGVDEDVMPPVRAPLDDAIAALRFVRDHADEWHVDMDRVGLTGGSAGACSSLYASLQADCEFGVRAVFAKSPQTSIDPKEMRAWIPDSRYGAHAFGYPSFDAWHDHRAECLSWIEKFSPAGLLRACTAEKAPTFFYSCAELPPPGQLAKDPTHSPVFCVKFQEICEAKGIACRRGTADEFIAELATARPAPARNIAAATPTPKTNETWWANRHAACVRAARAGGAPVVFLGDSITHFWDGRGRMQWNRYFGEGPRRALNCGFSADRTEHVLWRIDHGEFDGYEAKAIVLMIGTNNAGHKSFYDEPPCDTVIGIRAILDRLRAKQPTAKIILCAIFPRGKTPDDPIRRRNATVNHEIMRFADGKTVFWCDFTDQLLTPDGFLPAEVMPDRLHPADYGYEVWASAVIPYVDAALAGAPMPPNRYAAHVGTDFYREGAAPTQAISLVGRREHWWREPEMWFDALRRHRREAAQGDGAFDAVFIGDSITRGWETKGANVLAELRRTYRILPLGIGGDRVQHNIWRVRNGELDGYRTKLVVVMIGTNNNYGDKPQEVAAGIRVLLDEIKAKQPQAKILLLPVFPRGEKPDDPKRIQNAAVNAIIRDYADGKSVVWVDFTARLMRGDGTISKEMMPDYLHPLEEGYRIWAEAILPYLRDATGK